MELINIYWKSKFRSILNLSRVRFCGSLDSFLLMLALSATDYSSPDPSEARPVVLYVVSVHRHFITKTWTSAILTMMNWAMCMSNMNTSSPAATILTLGFCHNFSSWGVVCCLHYAVCNTAYYNDLHHLLIAAMLCEIFIIMLKYFAYIVTNMLACILMLEFYITIWMDEW